jgi:hypothetical protein
MKVPVSLSVGFRRFFVTARVIELWCCKCDKAIARSPHHAVLSMMEAAHVCKQNQVKVEGTAAAFSMPVPPPKAQRQSAAAFV